MCIVFSAVLNDKTLRKIAMQSDTKHANLGYMLGLRSTDVEQIKYKYSDLTDQAFYILMVRQQCFKALFTEEGTISNIYN